MRDFTRGRNNPSGSRQKHPDVIQHFLKALSRSARTQILLDCHPEQAFSAQRRIQASRAKRRVLCDAIIARLARFHIPLIPRVTWLSEGYPLRRLRLGVKAGEVVVAFVFVSHGTPPVRNSDYRDGDSRGCPILARTLR
jgi:hypothetical protein